MRNKFYLIVLIFLALFDDFMAMVLPLDYTYHSLSFVPHFCFIALMLIVYSKSWLDRALISALCGILTDYFFMPTFPKYFILYTFLGIGIGFLHDWMDEDDRNKGLVILGAMFLLDFVPYLWSLFTEVTKLHFQSWLLYQGFLTFTINGLMIALLIYTFNVYDRYKAIQKIRLQRVEKNRYKNIRLKRK